MLSSKCTNTFHVSQFRTSDVLFFGTVLFDGVLSKSEAVLSATPCYIVGPITTETWHTVLPVTWPIGRALDGACHSKHGPQHSRGPVTPKWCCSWELGVHLRVCFCQDPTSDPTVCMRVGACVINNCRVPGMSTFMTMVYLEMLLLRWIF